jgi:large subunit ribosomal protein L10
VTITFADKQKMVEEVNSEINKSLSIVVADYCGLTVAQMTKLRNSAKSGNVSFQVVRNRVAKIAVKDTKFESLVDSFVGSSMLAFSYEAPGEAARLLKSFIKEVPELKVKVISLGDGNIDASKLDFVAAMPSRDEALGLIAMLTKAPVRDVAISLKDVHGRMVRAISAFADQGASAN